MSPNSSCLSDNSDSMGSPLLKPGRLPVAARSSPLQATMSLDSSTSETDDSQVEFVSAEASAGLVGSEEAEDEESGTEHASGSEALSESEDEADVSKSGITEGSSASEQLSQSESESSIEFISDDPEDESFDATNIDDGAESSFEVTAPRKSRASTVRNARTSVQTPRASAAPKRASVLPSTIKKPPVNAKAVKTPKVSTGRQKQSAASQPLKESSANVSISVDSQSDVSLIAPPPKSVSPKKKR